MKTAKPARENRWHTSITIPVILADTLRDALEWIGLDARIRSSVEPKRVTLKTRLEPSQLNAELERQDALIAQQLETYRARGVIGGACIGNLERRRFQLATIREHLEPSQDARTEAAWFHAVRQRLEGDASLEQRAAWRYTSQGRDVYELEMRRTGDAVQAQLALHAGDGEPRAFEGVPQSEDALNLWDSLMDTLGATRSAAYPTS
jgi:hypothetical protein